jgi:hypothetical protein
MTSAAEQLHKLQILYPAAHAGSDGGVNFAYIPELGVGKAGHKQVVRALLYPSNDGGYSSRLFLDRQVPTTANYTWTTRVIAGETWWVVSFNGVPGTLPWTEILANHVRALQ